MKARYLDIRNFRALLPEAHGLPIAQRLENCLRGINDNQEPLRGSIDALIKHNERTLDSPRGSLRLRKADIEIAQGIDFLARTVHTQAIERPNSGPAKLHVVLQYPHHTSWKLVLPLQFLLKGWGDATRDHQCYVHTLCRENARHTLTRYARNSRGPRTGHPESVHIRRYHRQELASATRRALRRGSPGQQEAISSSMERKLGYRRCHVSLGVDGHQSLL